VRILVATALHPDFLGMLWLTGTTSNVPMLARLALPPTQSAQIANDRIKLGGGGWGGTFIGG
jgi:hypothetical protein